MVAETHATWNVRVYFEDTDAAGLVYYANYLKFFERARTEWLRAMGMQMSEMAQEFSATLVVSEAHITYQKPARLDDMIEISSALVKLGRASFSMTQSCRRGEAQLAVCTFRIACIDSDNQRPRALPSHWHALLAAKLQNIH